MRHGAAVTPFVVSTERNASALRLEQVPPTL